MQLWAMLSVIIWLRSCVMPLKPKAHISSTCSKLTLKDFIHQWDNAKTVINAGTKKYLPQLQILLHFQSFLLACLLISLFQWVFPNVDWTLNLLQTLAFKWRRKKVRKSPLSIFLQIANRWWIGGGIVSFAAARAGVTQRSPSPRGCFKLTYKVIPFPLFVGTGNWPIISQTLFEIEPIKLQQKTFPWLLIIANLFVWQP